MLYAQQDAGAWLRQIREPESGVRVYDRPSGQETALHGQEFAQLREWSEERELDWFLLAEPEHQAIQNWYKDLLHLYRKNKAMYEMDSDPAGFEWINADDCFRSIYSFVRHSKDGKKNLLFVCNFTPMERRITAWAFREGNS